MGKSNKVKVESSDSRAALLWMAAILLTVLVVYVPSLSGDFCLDDDLIIVDSTTAHGLRHLPEAFRTHFLPGFIGAESLYYRPLITVSFQLDYSLWGLNPHLFRFTNLLLYLACTGLVFGLARKLTGSLQAAGLAGLAFAVLPSHTESAAWICGRTDIIAVIFMLGSLLVFIKNVERPDGFSWKLASLSALLLMAGLFSKEAAAITPLLFVAYVYFYKKPITRADILKWLAVIVPVCIVYGAMRFWVLGNTFDGQTGELVGSRLIKIGLAYAIYLRTLFLPTEPILYSNTYAMDTATHMPIIITAWLAPLALITLAVISRRCLPVVAFSAVWILVGLVLQTELIPAAGLLKPAERFVYTASVGSSILLGWVFWRLYQFRPKSINVWPMVAGILVATFMLNAVVMSVIGIEARRSNLDWARYVARQKPNYWIFRASAAQFLADAGDIRTAAHEYEAVLEHGKMPAKSEAQFSYKLGMIYTSLEDGEGALRSFELAVKSDPTLGDAWKRLGLIKTIQGMVFIAGSEQESSKSLFEEAVSAYVQAGKLVDLDPTDYLMLGRAYRGLGKNKEAAREFAKAVAADLTGKAGEDAAAELEALSSTP